MRLGELEGPPKFKVDVLRHCLINKKKDIEKSVLLFRSKSFVQWIYN